MSVSHNAQALAIDSVGNPTEDYEDSYNFDGGLSSHDSSGNESEDGSSEYEDSSSEYDGIIRWRE
jgi:hypothetical protein